MTAMSNEKLKAAQTLASLHFRIEPGIQRIFVLQEKPEVEELPQTPIKLLEVSAETPASGVMPLRFGAVPARGIPFPSIIVEITPSEFDDIQTDALKLPEGWTIGEELLREAD